LKVLQVYNILCETRVMYIGQIGAILKPVAKNINTTYDFTSPNTQLQQKALPWATISYSKK